MLLRALAILFACALMAGAQARDDKPVAVTKIEDRTAFERLIGNSGLTVQWLGWTNSKRGILQADYRNRLLRLTGEQRDAAGGGRVSIDGIVTRIGKDEFIFDGTILIENTPDAGRRCEKTGPSRFAITQNRKYWRLREFEWCDDLTDYVDIYF
ncbi:MAG: hypothetical protein ACRCY3_04640 [Sphingorhabdus sp.]